ncbi:MAG: hypothetical protein AAGG48_07855 [Planctomycetota bacterium]
MFKLFRNPQQLVLTLIIVIVLWVLLAAQTKTLLLTTAATHLGLVILVLVQAVVVAWLMQIKRRMAIPLLLVSATGCSFLAARGFPTVFLVHSGELGYASVLTPITAMVLTVIVRQFVTQ